MRYPGGKPLSRGCIRLAEGFRIAWIKPCVLMDCYRVLVSEGCVPEKRRDKRGDDRTEPLKGLSEASRKSVNHYPPNTSIALYKPQTRILNRLSLPAWRAKVTDYWGLH